MSIIEIILCALLFAIAYSVIDKIVHRIDKILEKKLSSKTNDIVVCTMFIIAVALLVYRIFIRWKRSFIGSYKGENMVGKYTVITLCGSTRFKEDFLEQQKLLTLQGYIVISVGLFGHSGDDEVWTEGTKEMLDDMHKRKIDMADEIYVINKNGYIGESTLSEIKYAKSKEMPITYMECPNEDDIT